MNSTSLSIHVKKVTVSTLEFLIVNMTEGRLLASKVRAGSIIKVACTLKNLIAMVDMKNA